MKFTDRTNCTDRKANYPSEYDQDSLPDEMQFKDRKLFFTDPSSYSRTERTENIALLEMADTLRKFFRVK